MKKPCLVEDCEKPSYLRGLCDMHRTRLRRNGTLERKLDPIYVCTVDQCDHPHEAHGLCLMHIYRVKTHGTTDLPERTPPPCQADQCDRRAHAQGYCGMHYRRVRKYGTTHLPVRPERECTVDWCHEPYLASGYCLIHYQRVKNHGHIDFVGSQRSDITTYSSMHQRLRRDFGPASDFDCVDCYGPASDWSYDHSDPGELVENTERGVMPYSVHPGHYEARCKSCHTAFDKRYVTFGLASPAIPHRNTA